MSDDAPPPDEDSIEAGKRLVRARGNAGLSLGERLTNQFYRLTWRTPLHALRLRGRYPLKLLAVPDDPIKGDAARGQAMIDGTIIWRSESVPLESYDFSSAGVSASFNDYMQSFAWLRDLAAAGSRAETAPIAEALTQKWIALYAGAVSDVAWRADLWGRRTLFWAAHAPLILSSTDLVYRSAVLNALARGARHLDQVADRTPVGVDRMIAWCGIVAAGLLIAGGDPRRSFGEAGLAKAIASTFSSDGGTICRSPQSQLDAVMVLTMLRSVYAARKLPAPDVVERTLALAVPALLGVTMGDNGLSSWQGTGAISGRSVQAVLDGCALRTRPLRQARDWGYQRIQAGQTVLVLDGAPPPISRVAGAGCASTLAFELSDGETRLIVNCGGARMGGSMIPPALAEGLRTTAAHSTLILSDSNSTAIHHDGTLGRGVTEVELDRQESDRGSRIEISHDGYARRYGLVHRRSLAVSPDGREVRCDDVLLPAGTRRKPQIATFAVRFHIGPSVDVSPTADGMGALLRINQGPLWQFRCQGGTLSVDDSIWIDGDGKLHTTQQLVINGEAPPGGASVGWVLKRAG
jgi:uncharacterized heparinase superfamily protein